MANKNERLKAIIGKDIKDICEFELKNENIGFFTITDVVVSDDHSYAKVYVSFLRRKLKALKSNVTIKSIRSMGYILDYEKN